MRKRRDEEAITAEVAEALRGLVSSAKFELIPLSNALDRAESLPPGATVTVTASPSHGIEATFDLAEDVAARGHEAIPHLSAHMIRGDEHLRELLQRARDTGIRSVFVVGGDAKDRGEFHDGLSLLRAMDELGHPFAEIGVPAYPEGHPDIPDDVLLATLIEKQRYASYMTTQMCFSPGAVTTWIAGLRAQGVTLPVHLGVPGVAEIAKLMRVAARIGVADSARYLKKNRKIVGHLLSPGSFGPDALLEGLGSTVADPIAAIQRLHVFTFNEVGATVAWQQRMLTELGEVA
ncbi:MAG: methylenetetrahydrofolate reductase [Actinomycetota bacterium]